MGKERRLFQRLPLELDGSIFLRQAKDGESVCRPVNCRIVDLSKKGAGLIIRQVIVDNFHLFFGPLESDQIILHLNIDGQDSEAPPFTVAVRPLWFDRILFEDQQPFKMGIEFFEKIPEDDFRRLKKLAGH